MPTDQDKTIRKLRAILSADVKGYSLLMTDDEAFTIQTLKSYRQILSDMIHQYSGRVVDNPGDNLLAEFSSAVDAVDCAVRVQKKLKKENSKFVEEKRLEFRIGVNIGDVVHDGDRIYGEGVNIAARIESLADAGGVCISRSMYDQIKNKLQVDTEYLGEHDLKNINEPVRVYKILLDNESPKPLVEDQLELPDKPSIAVLPFDNMSGDSDQEYFSDGMTEQIINGLCKVSNLFVIARNSSFAYKGKSVSVKQIAKELGVRYILEGSVQRAGDRVRITAQLIDATTDYHMWSENYDRDVSDIFTLQDEITIKLIEAMQVQLTLGEQAHLWEGGTSNIQAFDNCMKGVEYFYRFNEKDNIQSRNYFNKALSFDETYSMPCAIMGFSHLIDILYGWSTSPLNSIEKAESCAKQALSQTDYLDLAHILLGWIYLFKREHDKAIQEGERAIELNPNGAEAHAGFGFILNFSDNSETAIKLLNRARRLNPITPVSYYNILGAAYRNIGNYEKSIEMSEKSIEKDPFQLVPHLIKATSCSLIDRLDDANMEIKESLRIDPQYSLTKFALSMLFKNKDVLDLYIGALRKAGLPE